MSAALDRILAAVVKRSRYDYRGIPRGIPDDETTDYSLSFGDWKDAIGSELHRLKASLEEIAQACDEHELWSGAAKLRAVAKEL